MSLLNDDKKIEFWIKQNGVCPLCENPINEADVLDVEKINIDHIVSRAHGGSDLIDNLQLSHRECNMMKGCGCDSWCEVQLGDLRPVVSGSYSPLVRKKIAWEKQSFKCAQCSEVIYPSDLQFAHYRYGKLSHRVCSK